MYWLDEFVIDWEKVETLEDVKLILQAIDFTFDAANPKVNTLTQLGHWQPKRIRITTS